MRKNNNFKMYEVYSELNKVDFKSKEVNKK